MKDLTTKYRPSDWDSIIDQDGLVKVLQREIKDDNIGHAYLFTGPRGTGKTTTARVFANKIDAVVIEMDAASNNGVEHIRALREDVQYLPVDGKKYKVYVIDEVHMLTAAAFNAFLKTLEEPPSHVIFVMATTDPQKIPITILSRCQRFDLKRITQQGIYNRLKYIAGEENIQFEAEALLYIAKSVDGGMRDAIRLLQKCSSIDNPITKSTVVDALGAVDVEHLAEVVGHLINKDASSALNKFHTLIDDGVDLRIFLMNLVDYLVAQGTDKIINEGFSIAEEIIIANQLLELIYQNRNLTMLKVSAELKFVYICLAPTENGPNPYTDSSKSVESDETVDLSNIDRVDVKAFQKLAETVKDLEKRLKMMGMAMGVKS